MMVGGPVSPNSWFFCFYFVNMSHSKLLGSSYNFKKRLLDYKSWITWYYMSYSSELCLINIVIWQNCNIRFNNRKVRVTVWLKSNSCSSFSFSFFFLFCLKIGTEANLISKMGKVINNANNWILSIIKGLISGTNLNLKPKEHCTRKFLYF